MTAHQLASGGAAHEADRFRPGDDDAMTGHSPASVDPAAGDHPCPLCPTDMGDDRHWSNQLECWICETCCTEPECAA